MPVLLVDRMRESTARRAASSRGPPGGRAPGASSWRAAASACRQRDHARKAPSTLVGRRRGRRGSKMRRGGAGARCQGVHASAARARSPSQASAAACRLPSCRLARRVPTSSSRRCACRSSRRGATPAGGALRGVARRVGAGGVSAAAGGPPAPCTPALPLLLGRVHAGDWHPQMQKRGRLPAPAPCRACSAGMHTRRTNRLSCCTAGSGSSTRQREAAQPAASASRLCTPVCSTLP
jgi:hypothetical protein